MGRKWIFGSFILLFVISAIAFTYDVNSTAISREKITSTEIKSEEIDIGIELEKETKEGHAFTSSITIPIANIDQIDIEIKRWSLEQEDLFFERIKKMDPPLSKYAEANFIIEPIVKRVKKDFLTYEFHVQSYIEDDFNEISKHKSETTSFVVNVKDESFVDLKDVIQIPEMKNKSEFTRFLTTIPEEKEKDQLASLDLKTTDEIQWLLNDKSIEFLIENSDNKNEVDRIFVDLKKLEKHLTKTYKKKFIPKKKKVKKETKKETDRKLVALTFDDGPDYNITPRILDSLDQHNAKATFFMLSRNVKNNPDIAKEVAKRGHEIANHSETHPNLNKTKKKQIKNEVIESKKTIKEITGVSPKLFRPPYGEYNSTVINLTNDSDQKIIMWSVDTLDWQHRNKNKTVNLALNQTKPGSIILMHDIHPTTADALPKLLAQLEKQAFEFVTVSELLDYIDPASNGVYYGR